MKSSGPFYQDQQAKFLSKNAQFDEQGYLSILSQINVYEISGKVDFTALQRYFYQQIIK